MNGAQKNVYHIGYIMTLCIFENKLCTSRFLTLHSLSNHAFLGGTSLLLIVYDVQSDAFKYNSVISEVATLISNTAVEKYSLISWVTKPDLIL